MSKSNGKKEEDYTNVVMVSKPTELPYLYIPYSSVTEARAKATIKDSGLDPNKTLYVFEPGKPTGYRIVAYPIRMEKPEEVEEIDVERQ